MQTVIIAIDLIILGAILTINHRISQIKKNLEK
jgi:hypothetical protein